MLFDIGQFEQHFDETILKRGLRFFERGAVELTLKQNTDEFRFVCAGNELHLRKKNGKVVFWHCTCGKTKFCGHLGAALFFLQKEALSSLSRKGKTRTKAHKRLLTKNLPLEVLEEFMRTSGSRNRSEPVRQLLLTVNEENCYDNYLHLFRLLLNPYHKQGLLNQDQINQAHHQLELLLEKIPAIKTGFNTRFYLHLALLTGLQDFLQLRFTGQEAKLQDLKASCMDVLDAMFRLGLSAREKASWQRAVFLSLRNNSVIRHEAYSFLLPRLLSWSRSKPLLEQLSDLLSRRKNTLVYHSCFNRLAIARWQVSHQEHFVFKTKLAVPDKSQRMDELMVRVELAFCGGRIKKAFNLLEQGLNLVSADYPACFEEFTGYVLERARQYEHRDLEMRCLEARMIRGLFIQSGELDYWLKHLPSNEKERRVKALVEEIKCARFYAFDKLSLLLQKTGQYDALIREIKKQGNAYRLLHEIVIKKLPDYDKPLLMLYAKHFVSSIAGLKIYGHQQLLFETARDYLDRLPADARGLTLDYIITHSGSESQLSRYIRGIYNLA